MAFLCFSESLWSQQRHRQATSWRTMAWKRSANWGLAKEITSRRQSVLDVGTSNCLPWQDWRVDWRCHDPPISTRSWRLEERLWTLPCPKVKGRTREPSNPFPEHAYDILQYTYRHLQTENWGVPIMFSQIIQDLLEITLTSCLSSIVLQASMQTRSLLTNQGFSFHQLIFWDFLSCFLSIVQGLGDAETCFEGSLASYPTLRSSSRIFHHSANASGSTDTDHQAGFGRVCSKVSVVTLWLLWHALTLLPDRMIGLCMRPSRHVSGLLPPESGQLNQHHNMASFLSEFRGFKSDHMWSLLQDAAVPFIPWWP